MRLIVRLLTALSVLAFGLAAPWSYAARNDDPAPGPVVLLAVGLLAALAATVLFVLAERRPGDLAVPARWQDATAGGTRLPLPAWWVPAGAAGLTVLAFAPFVSIPLTIAGAVLVLGAAAGLARWARRERTALDRTAVRAARGIRDFAVRHGADAGDPGVDVVVEHLGVPGARILLIGRDGHCGDLVVRDPERAELAAELAGARLCEGFPPDLVGRMRTGQYEWRRMAGIQLGGPDPEH